MSNGYNGRAVMSDDMGNIVTEMVTWGTSTVFVELDCVNPICACAMFTTMLAIF